MLWAMVEIFHMFRCRGAFGDLSGASRLIFGSSVCGCFKRKRSKQQCSWTKVLFVLNLAVESCRYYQSLSLRLRPIFDM